MKKSLIVLSLLCLLLASTSVISAYKPPQAAPYANAEPSIEEPTCVSQEVVLVDGVDVALSLYVDQGVLVRKMCIRDRTGDAAFLFPLAVDQNHLVGAVVCANV